MFIAMALVRFVKCLQRLTQLPEERAGDVTGPAQSPDRGIDTRSHLASIHRNPSCDHAIWGLTIRGKCPLSWEDVTR